MAVPAWFKCVLLTVAQYRRVHVVHEVYFCEKGWTTKQEPAQFLKVEGQNFGGGGWFASFNMGGGKY